MTTKQIGAATFGKRSQRQRQRTQTPSHKHMNSLSDLVQDVRNGSAKTFQYDMTRFAVVKVSTGYWIKHPAGRAAFMPAINDSMDLHGPAAFLIAHPQEQVYHFDRAGNLFAPAAFVKRYHAGEFITRH